MRGWPAPAATGSYASLLVPVAYALRGTSRHLGPGPEPGTAVRAATDVAAVAGADPEVSRYLALMAALLVMVGMVAGITWLLGLGFVARLLSEPVLMGYISGAGAGEQRRSPFTGVAMAADSFFPRVVEFLRAIDQLRPVTVLLGWGCLLRNLALRRFASRAPGALIAVGLATSVSAWFDLPLRGDPTIGAIPTGLPALGVPEVAGTGSSTSTSTADRKIRDESDRQGDR